MPFEPQLKVSTKTRRSKPKAQNKLKLLILNLTLKGWSNPDIARHPEIDLTISKSGMSQRVWQIQSELVKDGKLVRSIKTNRLERPFEELQKHKWNKISNSDAIEKCASLAKMWNHLMQKKQGRGDPKAKTWLNNFLTVCNTTNIHPDEIANAVDSDNNPAWLAKSTEVMIEFRKLFHEDKIVRQSAVTGASRHYDDAETKTLVNYKMSLRQFLLAQGFHIPELPLEHVLTGSKGNLFGAYNKIGMDDKTYDEFLDFAEIESKDFGYVGAVALMPEMITRTRSLFTWIVNYSTEYDEFESEPVEFDFVKAFHETKTEKSKADWDKFIINPRVRKILQEVGKERKGKTLVELNTQRRTTPTQEVEAEFNRICMEYYIKIGVLDETARLPRMVNHEKNPERSFYSQGTEQYFYDNRGAYVLRHTGAHLWCRRTKYDYGFVSELGWGDMNTLKKCYAGMDLRSMLRASMCMYCKPPVNPDKVINHQFCSATHAFIFYSNGLKAKSYSDLSNIAPDVQSIETNSKALAS